MKIKKFNELYIHEYPSYTEDELDKFRNKRFNTKYDTSYSIYGEYFSNGDIKPQYTLLHSDYNMGNVINWFTAVERKGYKKYILVENNEESKILDLNLFINSKKYNL